MLVEYKKKKISLPDFLIIGAAKAGTSSLNYWLNDCDEIIMTDPKEPNFFSFANFQKDYLNNKELNKAANLYNYNFDEYQKILKFNKEKLIGDASTSYFDYPDNVIFNIKKYYGIKSKDLKAVCLLRNPVDKIYSHYLMFKKWGIENREFKDVIFGEIKKKQSAIEAQIDYISQGYYYNKVKTYKAFFGQNLKIYLFDDFLKEKDRIVSDILTHIGVKNLCLPSNINEIFNEGGIPKSVVGEKIINFKKNREFIEVVKLLIPLNIKVQLKKIDKVIQSKLTYKPTIDENVREFLKKMYQEDLLNTSTLLNCDLSGWTK